MLEADPLADKHQLKAEVAWLITQACNYLRRALELYEDAGNELGMDAMEEHLSLLDAWVEISMRPSRTA